ncbi:hypothetical protein [Herbidospora mongoliensis]|uniref:hypothetical protein n=1 Tax=Herbidospora mongoliensis TaxID=688067 RepID=UPI00082C183E|nr:hypothetical protein [Herbidospora mongoliensis]
MSPLILTLLCAAVAALGVVCAAIAHRRRNHPHRTVAAIATVLMVVVCAATLVPGMWAAAALVPNPIWYSVAVLLVVLGTCVAVGLNQWLRRESASSR